MKQIIVTDVSGENTTGYMETVPDLRRIYTQDYLLIRQTDRDFEETA